MFRPVLAKSSLAVLLLGIAGGSVARAQSYPARPVTMVVAFPAGGLADVVARLVAQHLTERLGKPFVIENRPGAGTVLGANSVAKAAPDGYTLLLGGSAPFAMAASLHNKLPYDPVKDFEPLALIAEGPFVLVVNPALPAYSVADLIKLAKEKPGRLSYATAGSGSPHHLYAELFKGMAAIQMVHIPYKGAVQSLTDVAAGHVPLMFSDFATALPLIREGKVRALGLTSTRRVGVAPEIPTIAESGVPGFDAVVWLMAAAPAHTPNVIVEAVHTELKHLGGLPEFQKRMADTGLIAVHSPSPDRLRAFIATEIERWGKVVKQSGIALE
jgi:tripartite-type tricarboxylate transporter receptor subunit TctC